MAIRLYIKDSDAPATGTEGRRDIGAISSEQLQLLIDLLEEEGPGDQDYWVDKDILEYLEQESVDAELLALLKPHVTDEGIEIEWKEEA